MDEGMKFDKGKQPWHALPLELLWPLADLMDVGAVKYEKFNCLQPFGNSDERFWDAIMRHLADCQIDPLALDFRPENEDDVGTGCFHLACATFGCLLRLRNALLKLSEEERLAVMTRYKKAMSQAKDAIIRNQKIQEDKIKREI